jgi:hypothetical protein
MVMKNGDDCGSNGDRLSRVYFKCNKNLSKAQIEEVSEPQTCQYKIVLATTLACEDSVSGNYVNSMNVYPYLNESLKFKWNTIYSELLNGLITEKVSLKKFF